MNQEKKGIIHKICAEYLKTSNIALNKLISKMRSSFIRNVLDNHALTVYEQEMKAKSIELFKAISNTYPDIPVRERYKEFINVSYNNLRVVIKFIYKDKFRNLERIKDSIQWYQKEHKTKLVTVITEILTIAEQQELEAEIEALPDKATLTVISNVEPAQNSECPDTNKEFELQEKQHIITVLMGGSGLVSRRIIYEYYTQNKPSTNDFVKYLKDTYGTGGAYWPEPLNGIKSENSSSKGITFEWIDSDAVVHKTNLTWPEVAKNIVHLIEMCLYLPEKIDAKGSADELPESAINEAQVDNGKDEEIGKEEPFEEPQQIEARKRRKKKKAEDNQLSLFALEPIVTKESTQESNADTAETAGAITPEGMQNPETNTTLEAYTGSIQDYGGTKTKCLNNLAAIKLLKVIEAEGRQANKDEKVILDSYTGWGGIPQIFNVPVSPDWEKEQKLLSSLLTQEEYADARASTVNAFYTPDEVINFMYKTVERMGFQGGRILEPALGTGKFISGCTDTIRANSNFTGVELDTITGRIAKLIYPDANIRIQGFENATLRDDYYDLVISNVPFGNYHVHDPKYKKMKMPIHDYFFAKALDKVKPGGIVAFITSRFTMDKKDDTFRKYLSSRAEFVGAVRLPNDTFKKIAGTEVTSDIIFLRKSDGTIYKGQEWVNSTAINALNNGLEYNEYYVKCPNMIMGEISTWTRMYAREDITVNAIETPLQELLDKAVAEFPTNITISAPASAVTTNIATTVAEVLPSDGSMKNYSFVLLNGAIYQREDAVLNKVAETGKTFDRLKGMISIRDILRELITSMTQNLPDATIHSLQAELGKKYDAFVKKHGYLNNRTNKSLFNEDPDSPLLLSLELINETTGVASKAEIFKSRTIKPAKNYNTAGTSEEALIISMNETAEVDLAYMSLLTGKPEEDIITELAGKILYNPKDKKWELADQFLSGDVVKKLNYTQYALSNASTPEEKTTMEMSLSALQSVQPEPVLAENIDVRLGSTWIPEDLIVDFIAHLYKADSYSKKGIEVKFLPATSEWVCSVGSKFQYATINTNTWGTWRCPGEKLIEQALNLKQPTVYDTVDKQQVFNKNETLTARAKQDLIKEAFKGWIFDEPQRRRHLQELYNKKFNCHRLRTYNGDYLQLPGMSTAIQLNKHQKDAVARIILSGKNTLLDHVVGSGKTFCVTAACMELRRLGIVNKNLIVVPNHLTEEWGKEFLRLYPTAKILVCTKKDFQKINRKRLIARIATNDWDAVIISHSMFGKIPVSKPIMEQYINEEIRQVEESLRQLQSTYRYNRRVKDLERKRKKLQAKLEETYNAGSKDDVVYFEELGVDQLFVDEADEFKNLGCVTKLNRIAGISENTSQKALDMFLKTRYINSIRGQKGVVFATGTPIANSMVELYTMQRYLQYERLESAGLLAFDSWASTFGEVVSAMEIAPDGSGYRIKQRFCKFFNLPELITMYRDIADVRTKEMLNLPCPELETGKPIDESTEPTIQLKDYISELVDRSEEIRGHRVSPKDDNMLLVTNDGRKAALDYRITCPSAPDSPLYKVNVAADNIYDIWGKTKSNKSVQLVFCDLSTPGSNGFCIYDELKAKLINKGIPKEEIAFIHDANTEAQKTTLFAKTRAGTVRILIGSTFKMGAGTNVQDRAVALHHLDAPWRPRDIEQREGRILRQGNKNEKVMIFRYVTKGSFDAYMWQTLENKARFISQIRSGCTTVRNAEDVDTATLSFAEVKALASGNPLILEKVKIDQEVQQYQILKTMYARNRYRLQDDLSRKKSFIKRSTEFITGVKKDIETRDLNTMSGFEIEIDGKIYNEKKEAGEILMTEATKFVCQVKSLPDSFISEQKKEIGMFRGFKIIIAYRNNIANVMDRPDIVLKGENEYRDEIAFVGSKNISKIEGLLSSLKNRLEEKEKSVAKSKSDLLQIAEDLLKPFEKETELESLIKRQSELNTILDKGKTSEVIGETEADL